VRAAWVGAIVIAGVVGAAAGVLGLVGRPEAAPSTTPLVGAIPGRVLALECPGGDPIGSLGDGDRVLVVARTSDGDYLAVRSPGADYETVWVSADAVDTGPIEASLARADLPVDDCVRPEVSR
jgi:hypothetical protein